MNRTVPVALFTLLLAGLPRGPVARADAPPPDLERGRFLEACRAAVRYYDEELAKELSLQARGGTSAAAVGFARVNLAIARFNLADADGRPDLQAEQLRAITKVREDDLGRMDTLYRDRGVQAWHVDLARRRLAWPRYRLAQVEGRAEDAVAELKQIIRLCEGDVNRLAGVPGAGTVAASEVEVSRGRLAYARFRLAVAEGRPEDAVAQLRLAAESRGRDFDRLRRLARQGAMPEYVVNTAHLLWLKARVRLAIADQDPAAARADVARAIPLLERMYRQVETGGEFEKWQRAWVTYELGYERHRLALVDAGQDVPLDDPIYELGL
jgi:hypothetical protein